MKKLLLSALLCLFGLSATASAGITTTKEFDLESNFCRTVARIIQNPKVFSPSEIHQAVRLKKGIAHKEDKGLIWYQITRNQVTSRGEKVWFKTYLALNQKSLIIVSVLDSESVNLDHSVMQIEVHENGTGSTIKYSLMVDMDGSPFLIRLGMRTQLYRMEKSLRKLVGELEENEEE